MVMSGFVGDERIRVDGLLVSIFVQEWLVG